MENNSGKTPEYVKCLKCNGSGRIGSLECAECNGTGFEIVKCDKCHWGRASCRKCGGTGYEAIEDEDGCITGHSEKECWECGGKGYLECEVCDGKGVVCKEIDSNENEIFVIDKPEEFEKFLRGRKIYHRFTEDEKKHHVDGAIGSTELVYGYKVKGDLKINCSFCVRKNLEIVGSLEVTNNNLFEINANLEVHGFIKTEGSIMVVGTLDVDRFIKAKGSILARNRIFTGGAIKIIGNIETRYIRAGSCIEVNGIITCQNKDAGSTIKADSIRKLFKDELPKFVKLPETK